MHFALAPHTSGQLVHLTWKEKYAPKALEPMYIFEDNLCWMCGGVDRSVVVEVEEVEMGFTEEELLQAARKLKDEDG